MTKKKSVGELFGDAGPYMSLGGELAAVVIATTLIGWWIDSSFHTSPWGIVIGSTFGVTGGMIKFIREATALASEDKEHSQHKE